MIQSRQSVEHRCCHQRMLPRYVHDVDYDAVSFALEQAQPAARHLLVICSYRSALCVGFAWIMDDVRGRSVPSVNTMQLVMMSISPAENRARIFCRLISEVSH